MKKLVSLLVIILGLFICCGCDTTIIQSSKITINTTSYPLEFLCETLYGENATITSIYPDGSDIETYKFTSKQLDDYAQSTMFIYNGLTDEKDIARKLINRNTSLKIVDVSYGLTLENSTEELWLSPSNFLMLASTLKDNLEDLIDSKYATETIEANYEELKTTISQMDAELRTVASNVSNPTLVVDSNAFKFLENYGYKIISLEDEENITTNSLASLQNNFSNSTYKYVLVRNDKEISDVANSLINNYNATSIQMNMMSTIEEEQRDNNEDYYSLLQENIENIRNVVIGS